MVMAQVTSPSPLAVWAKKHPFGLFVALSYGISWALWVPSGLILPPVTATVGHYAGAFGPMIAAMVVVALQGGSVRQEHTVPAKA